MSWKKIKRIRDLSDACYEKCPFYLNYTTIGSRSQYMIDTIVFAIFKGKLVIVQNKKKYFL